MINVHCRAISHTIFLIFLSGYVCPFGMIEVSLTSWRHWIISCKDRVNPFDHGFKGLGNTSPCKSDDNLIHYIQLILGNIMRSLLFPLLYELTLVFTYSAMIVTLFPLLTMIYFFLDMSPPPLPLCAMVDATLVFLCM